MTLSSSRSVSVELAKVTLLWAAVPFIVVAALAKDLAEAVWELYGP